MRLRCIGRMAAHWGSIFEIGNEYQVVDIVNRSVSIITGRILKTHNRNKTLRELGI